MCTSLIRCFYIHTANSVGVIIGVVAVAIIILILVVLIVFVLIFCKIQQRNAVLFGWEFGRKLRMKFGRKLGNVLFCAVYLYYTVTISDVFSIDKGLREDPENP